MVHDVHCLTRGDVAVMPRACSWITVDGDRLRRSRCIGGEEKLLGTDSKRTRAGTRRGSRIEVGREGRRGAVGLRLVLMSCFLSLPDHSPLASYRLGSNVIVVGHGRLGRPVKVLRYGRALRTVKEVVPKPRRNPDEIAWHSLCIGGAAALAVGRDISERVIKRKGRWRSDTCKTYKRKSVDVARRIWNMRGVASGVMKRQPGEGTVWGKK